MFKIIAYVIELLVDGQRRDAQWQLSSNFAFKRLLKPFSERREMKVVKFYFVNFIIMYIILRIHFYQKAHYVSMFNVLHVPRSRSFALCSFLNCSLKVWKKLKDDDLTVLPIELRLSICFVSRKYPPSPKHILC